MLVLCEHSHSSLLHLKTNSEVQIDNSALSNLHNHVETFASWFLELSVTGTASFR